MILCKLGFHRWTEDNPISKALMIGDFGKPFGCTRCGLLEGYMNKSLKTKFSEILQKTRNNALPDNEKTGLEPYDELTIDQAVDEILLTVKKEMLEIINPMKLEDQWSSHHRDGYYMAIEEIRERLEAIK